MGLIKTIIQKIKNVGVGKAIDLLDNFEKPLAQKIEAEKQKLNSMSSEEQAKWIVDAVQTALRIYAAVPAK